MKKITIGLLVTTLILSAIVIKMTTNDYKFEPTAQAQSPINPESKSQVSQMLDELLPDKVFDLIWKRTFHYLTLFESLDGFTLTGVPTLSGADVTLTTSNVSGNEIEINKQPSWQGLITFSQRSAFRTAFIISQITNQTVYITTGNKASGSYYGFKITNATLYGVTGDGTTENAVTLKTISATTGYNLEARFLPSKGVTFFVDSVEVGSSSANIPIPIVTPNAQLMDIRIKTNANEVKTMQMSFFEYMQFRNVLK